MPANMSPAVRTVLQLLQARQMFIGDELRISALRMAWSESGHASEDFGDAISQLKQLGYVRTVHGTAGPAVQLTQAGFRASTQQPRRTPQRPTGGRPAVRQSQAARDVAARPLPTRAAPRKPSQPRPSPPRRRPEPASNVDRQAPQTRAQTDQQLAHAQVFRTRNESLSDNVLRHCLLGLLNYLKLKANGTVGYVTIMHHWDEMGLTRSDLLYTLELLINAGEVRTVSEPEETIILTSQGHASATGSPRDLNDGMDRFNAVKRLRLTKQLGSLRAAV